MAAGKIKFAADLQGSARSDKNGRWIIDFEKSLTEFGLSDNKEQLVRAVQKIHNFTGLNHKTIAGAYSLLRRFGNKIPDSEQFAASPHVATISAQIPESLNKYSNKKRIANDKFAAEKIKAELFIYLQLIGNGNR